MKRSQVNDILHEGDSFIRSFGYVLPPFAYMSPDALRNTSYELIKKRRMGWDITDYGQGRFEDLGLLLFTLRNGLMDDLSTGRGMLYAEKIIEGEGGI